MWVVQQLSTYSNSTKRQTEVSLYQKRCEDLTLNVLNRAIKVHKVQQYFKEFCTEFCVIFQIVVWIIDEHEKQNKSD